MKSFYINKDIPIQCDEEDATDFKIPCVQSELEGMLPWNASIFEFIAWILCISSTFATFIIEIPVYYYIVFHAVFRLSYDFGLGLLLSKQSKYKSFTKVWLNFLELYYT